MFPVSTEKAEALNRRMMDLGIDEKDLQEKFVHAGGNGGQNVNKVATCVWLVHGPSGLSVKCQQARTQGMNRYYARQMLIDKMDALVRGEESKKEQAREKLRRQKRRRSRRSKQRMLNDKHAQSAKKDLRKAPRND